jgi:steroid 5-alpha reductase family enzyme
MELPNSKVSRLTYNSLEDYIGDFFHDTVLLQYNLYVIILRHLLYIIIDNTTRYALLDNKKPLTPEYSKGFLTRGLFAYSRHPNFFCEISLWWSFYVFAISVTKEAIHWSIVGTILLTLLFQGSTTFTETITLKKYPEYAEYQRTTSRLIPWFPGSKAKKI